MLLWGSNLFPGPFSMAVQPSRGRSLSAALQVQQLSCAGERERKKEKIPSASKTDYK